MSYVEFKNVRKVYQTGEVAVEALRKVDFGLERGELTVIVGPSGAGKTTVLNLLGGMDSVTEGAITLDDDEVSAYRGRRLVEYRRQDVGFVFQFYNLVQNLTALENVELASQICRNPLDPETCLRQVGLDERLQNFPAQLSGGEQQRVAIARALAKNPKLLLCDEPTGALDYETGRNILVLLQETCKREQRTVVIITHNQAFEALADRVIHINNGQVMRCETNAHPVSAATIEW